MKRLIIACLTLACGLFWLAAGAPVFGGSNLLGSGVLGKLSGDVSEAQSGQGAEARSSGDVTDLLPGQGADDGGRDGRMRVNPFAVARPHRWWAFWRRS